MKPSLYVALDLGLLTMVIIGLVIVDQDALWIFGFAAIWLAISACWLVLDSWWRRNA